MMVPGGDEPVRQQKPAMQALEGMPLVVIGAHVEICTCADRVGRRVERLDGLAVGRGCWGRLGRRP